MSAGSPSPSGSSFTALLGLPAGIQAIELRPPRPGKLRQPAMAAPAARSGARASAAALGRMPADLPLRRRSGRDGRLILSIYHAAAGGDRPLASNSGDPRPRKPKPEPVDLDAAAIDAAARLPAKRKEPLRGKANGSASPKKKKNGRSAEEGDCMPPEELGGGGGDDDEKKQQLRPRPSSPWPGD